MRCKYEEIYYEENYYEEKEVYELSGICGSSNIGSFSNILAEDK